MVLPLSTIVNRGYTPEVYVFDTANNGFRQIGLVDESGNVKTSDPAGDGIRLVKGKLYRLIVRPQYCAFKPEQLVIGSGTTPGGADDWNVHDITVGNRSQFSQDGIVPGGMFKADAAGSTVGFETVQTAMNFGIEVSYQGPNDTEPFLGSVIGTAVNY